MTRPKALIDQMRTSTRIEERGNFTALGSGVNKRWEPCNVDTTIKPREALLIRLGIAIGRDDVQPCACGWRHVENNRCTWCGIERDRDESARIADCQDDAGQDAGMTLHPLPESSCLGDHDAVGQRA